MKSFFLPIGLVVAVAVGVLCPPPGLFLAGTGVVGVSLRHWMIITIFLVSGYQLRGRDFRFGRVFGAVFAMAITVNLLLGPLVATLVGRFFHVSSGHYVGLVAMGCVPTTLASCIVITANAKGNASLALMLTILLTFAGILLIPFTLGLSLNLGTAVRVPVLPLAGKMLMLVLLPLVVGMQLRKLLMARTHSVLGYVPSLAVIMTVWMTVSKNADGLKGLSWIALGSLVVTALVMHMILLGLSWGGGRILRLNLADSRALLFVGGQKTLPIAVAVLLALPVEQVAAGVLGLAMIFCVQFHFLQIVGDSLLAAWLVRRR